MSDWRRPLTPEQMLVGMIANEFSWFYSTHNHLKKGGFNTGPMLAKVRGDLEAALAIEKAHRKKAYRD